MTKATEDLQETQRVLEAAKARLTEVEEGIASLQAKYEECISKKQELEFKTEQCSGRLTRAEKVQRKMDGGGGGGDNYDSDDDDNDDAR